MKYNKYIVEKLNKNINNIEIIEKSRKNIKDFTRKRKISVKDIILYNLNKRGYSNKMEINDFMEICNKNNVSDVAMLRQREKLNEDVFKYLNDESLEPVYNIFKNDVKTFKGYILTAIDGSDLEVPNTIENRQRYKAKNQTSNNCARIKLSNCYDLLNNFVLDTQVEEYKHSELELASRHLSKTKELIGDFRQIRIMDRGYVSLIDMFNSIKNDDKFVVRLQLEKFKEEQNCMTTDDEYVNIKYQYNRIRNYKNKNGELYNFYEKGNTINARFTKVVLSTGEIEILVSNLEMDTFTKEDINKLYNLRWGIETSYHYLKESMKICNISSSKDCIIKQEIYSQMLVFNILQAIQNNLDEEIEQDKYKNKMKININMAVGYIKKRLIYILLENNHKRRSKLFEELNKKILDNIVPIRNGRRYPRDKVVKNKYHINKRKSF